MPMSKKFESVPGKDERRQKKLVQKILWERERVHGCQPDDLFDRRVDPATLRALSNMLHSVRTHKGQGLIFGILNEDGTVDMGFTGKLFDSPVLADWITRRLCELVRQLPDHPACEDNLQQLPL